MWGEQHADHRELGQTDVQGEGGSASRQLSGLQGRQPLREGYDPNFGARPLKRSIERLVQDPLAVKILHDEVHRGDRVVADVADGKMKFVASRQLGERSETQVRVLATPARERERRKSQTSRPSGRPVRNSAR